MEKSNSQVVLKKAEVDETKQVITSVDFNLPIEKLGFKINDETVGQAATIVDNVSKSFDALQTSYAVDKPDNADGMKSASIFIPKANQVITQDVIRTTKDTTFTITAEPTGQYKAMAKAIANVEIPSYEDKAFTLFYGRQMFIPSKDSTYHWTLAVWSDLPEERHSQNILSSIIYRNAYIMLFDDSYSPGSAPVLTNYVLEDYNTETGKPTQLTFKINGSEWMAGNSQYYPSTDYAFWKKTNTFKLSSMNRPWN